MNEKDRDSISVVIKTGASFSAAVMLLGFLTDSRVLLNYGILAVILSAFAEIIAVFLVCFFRKERLLSLFSFLIVAVMVLSVFAKL